MGAYLASVLAIPSLVSCWPLDESSGNAIDTQGLNNGSPSAEGLTRAQASLLPNGEGKSCTFDGSKGFFTLADTASLDVGDKFSIAWWIKFSTEGTAKVIFGGPSNAPQFYYNASNKLDLDKRAAKALAVANAASVKDTVYFVGCVKNGTTRKLFINGVEVAATLQEATVEKPAGAYAIGRDGGAASSFWAGQQQYGSLFNDELSAGTWAALYAAGFVRGTPRSLLGVGR